MYHSMFGINDKSGTSSHISHVKEKMAGVQYIFFDEVSMLLVKNLHCIHVQLARVFDCAHMPFGNLNMVFSGDFAQLPPAMEGENVSLYSKTIGSISTDIKSQEEAIRKALWCQMTTVVILHENMWQKHQSTKDAQF
jgi:PIF1-like helicase